MKYAYVNSVTDKKLLEFLSEQIDGVSLSVLKRQMKLGEIKVDGIKTRENIALESGARVEIFLPKDSVRKPSISIEYLDENVVVVNKPYNTDVENNLVRLVGEEVEGELYPVHRLDRNTEGLVIFARDAESRHILDEAVKARKIVKIYRALLCGNFEKKEFTDTAYLKKDPLTSTVKVFADPTEEAKEIITRFKIVKDFEGYCEAEITLVTGRTHQIRAHAAFLGHPVLGDGKYGKRECNDKFGYSRQQLRATQLIFGGLDGKLKYLNGAVIALKVL